jgi:TPR repeat protein
VDASAQLNLGAIFGHGRGTPKDNVMAYVWFNIAAAQGNEKAKEIEAL